MDVLVKGRNTGASRPTETTTHDLEDLVEDYNRVNDYIKKNTQKMKPYRAKLKQTKEELREVVSRLPDQVLQVGEDNYFQVEQRKKKVSFNIAYVRRKIVQFFAGQDKDDLQQSLLDYIESAEYEDAHSLRQKKGVYGNKDKEKTKELTYSDEEDETPNAAHFDDEDY